MRIIFSFDTTIELRVEGNPIIFINLHLDPSSNLGTVFAHILHLVSNHSFRGKLRLTDLKDRTYSNIFPHKIYVLKNLENNMTLY